MSDDLYTQCELRHEDGRVDVCWIPRNLARVGLQLIINDESGWCVERAYLTLAKSSIANSRSAGRHFQENLDPHC